MIRAGVWLIYAGVALRALVRFAGLPEWRPVAVLLALYALLLALEPWPSSHAFWPRGRSAPSHDSAGSEEPAPRRLFLSVIGLVLQTALVVGLFAVPPHIDFFAGLFVPLALQAVLLFGRPVGYIPIALFPLAMFVPMTANPRGWPFALAMSLFAGAVCFLFAGYAHQVRTAETTRSQTGRLLDRLAVAHRQLAGYTAQLEQLAAEQERGRLARDIHDSVTQTVFSMTLTVQSARLLLNRDPGRAAAQIERLEELAASAMTEIQTLASHLRLPSHADGGLPATLRRLAAQRGARDGLQVMLDVQGERTLPPAVVDGLVRIIQEALTNVVKHAATSAASVRLDLGGDLALLEVEDRGRGFDPQASPSQRGHLGLAGMGEAAREIGWDLFIDSRPGAGTRIRVRERSPEESA